MGPRPETHQSQKVDVALINVGSAGVSLLELPADVRPSLFQKRLSSVISQSGAVTYMDNTERIRLPLYANALFRSKKLSGGQRPSFSEMPLALDVPFAALM